MTIEDSYNFKRAGRLVTTSGVVGADCLRSIGLEGYEVIIDLLPSDNRDAVGNERQLVEAQGVTYVHIPVDFKRPTLFDYDQFVSAIGAAKTKKVHVHCAANYRASVFYALYAESCGLWSESETRDFLADLWQPLEYDGWPQFIVDVRERDKGV